MPRHKLIRKIISPPHFKGFSPIGLSADGQVVVLDFEEYEAIRLCDYDMYNHLEASRVMNVSRPTFARIYEEARQKVAFAFVQGLPIIFEGGKVYYDSDWYSCTTCNCKFNHLQKDKPVMQCALCGSETISPVQDEPVAESNEHLCYCQACGHQKPVKRGIPCSHVVCDSCNSRMRRHREPNVK